jgi:predicted Rossmann fold flavoprotein
MMTAENSIQELAVVGGGASGAFAALAAAQTAEKKKIKVHIRIYEAADRVLKKILITGNGRCNLSNTDMTAAHYFGAVDLFSKVYALFDREAALAFFDSLGLATVSDPSGRIYPMSMKAASVVDVLLRGFEKYGIEILTDTKITSLKKAKYGFLLNNSFYADKIILSAGGKVGATGKQSDSVYGIVHSLGVKCSALQPVLTAFVVSDFTKSLKGIRSAGNLTLISDRDRIASKCGEIQYTEYGISGIPAMQLSSYAARSHGNQLFIMADSLPEIKEEAFIRRINYMIETDPQMPVQLFLAGLLPKPLGVYLLKESGVSPEFRLKNLTDKHISSLLENCKRKKYAVKSVRGFENAQATGGGIAGAEISENLELKKCRGIYVCGELIDLDGDCGGYNLQWAWSSGAVAGINSIMEMQ